MANRPKPKTDAGRVSILEAVMQEGAKPKRLEGVYRTRSGLYKMEAAHTKRVNMVLPPSLVDAFDSIVEREAGRGKRTEIIESLMIGYLIENGIETE